MKKRIIILITSILAILALVLIYSPTKAAVGRIMYSLRWTNGLVGYWSFNGSDMNWTANQALDRSGQSNNGLLVGMSTTTSPTPGVVGQALKFDGSDDYVVVPDSASLDVTDAITIEAWVFLSSDNINDGLVYKGDFASTQGVYSFGFFTGSNNKLGFRLNGNTVEGSGQLTSATALSTGQWYHVAATYDSVNQKIFINGAQDASVAFTTSISTDTNNLIIGGYYAITQLFTGFIDEVRIYNRVLSANEIKYHYDRTAPQFRSQINRSFKDEWKNGLVGYWSFNGSDMNWTANQALDRSGQSNNGLLVGMSTTTSPVPGVVGQALNFNSNSVALGTLTISAQGSPFSAFMWIKTNQINATTAVCGEAGLIFSKRDGTNTFCLGVGSNTNANTVGISSWSGLPADDVVGTVSINDGNWHYVGFTWDGTTAYLYIDGSFNTSKAISFITQSIANGNSLGAFDSGTTRAYIGKLDEVRIYNRVLTAAEILEHYQKTAPAYRSQVNAPQKDKWTNGLVGYWSFNGSDMNWTANQALDRSGQSNNGLLVGMSTTTSPVPGVVGQALKFDGSDDYVSVTDSTSLDITGDITISAWVNTISLANSPELITKFTGAFEVELMSDGSVLLAKYGAAIMARSYASVIANGSWYHVVALKNGATNAIYVNGVNVTDPATISNQTFVANSNPVTIGSNGSAYFLNGRIDEVRIYNRALTAAEIYEHYKSGRR